MERFNDLSVELKEMLTIADEQLDWTYTVWIEPGQNNRTYAEMGKYSPADEDFNMVIYFDKDNQVETFLTDLRDYAENFDVDEHVEMWLESRGKGGCPSTLKELLEDAIDIKAMIKELLDKLENISEQDLELSDEQIARNDELPTVELMLPDGKRITVPEIVDISAIGTFDELEYSLWHMIEEYLVLFGIRTYDDTPDWATVKAVQDSILTVLTDAGVNFKLFTDEKQEVINKALERKESEANG